MISTVPTPVDGYPDQSFRVSLGDTQYGLRWLWNGREGVWTLSVSDADGEPILSGVRVVLDVDLLAYTADARAPQGYLIVSDPSGGTTEPGLDELGNRVQVLFVTLDEIA